MKTKRTKKQKPIPPLPQAAGSEMAASMAAIKAQGCFRCDGTKELCNVCGESARACECPEEEQSFYECPDCKSPNDPSSAMKAGQKGNDEH